MGLRAWKEGIMKTYKIPCTWEMYGVLDIRAKTMKEAIKIAENDQTTDLPDERTYVDGSFEVDREICEIDN